VYKSTQLYDKEFRYFKLNLKLKFINLLPILDTVSDYIFNLRMPNEVIGIRRL